MGVLVFITPSTTLNNLQDPPFLPPHPHSTMATKAAATIFSLLLTATLLLVGPSAAHNITRLLSDYPDFSSFNSLLSGTKLADEINRRHTITVLAVSNGGVGSVTGLSPELQRRVLSVHVVLDYYDMDKLHALKNRSGVLTTLFQTTGIADSRTGFLNVTKFNDGRISFGSASAAAGLVSDLMGSVAARPYNISVLQVSSVIVPPGIDGLSNHAPPPPPTSHAAPAPAPAKAKAKAPPKAPAPAAEAPVEEAAPTDAPVADAPVVDTPAEAPEADSPKGAVDLDEDDATSGAGRVAVIGAGLGAIMGAVLVAAL